MSAGDSEIEAKLRVDVAVVTALSETRGRRVDFVSIRRDLTTFRCIEPTSENL